MWDSRRRPVLLESNNRAQPSTAFPPWNNKDSILSRSRKSIAPYHVHRALLPPPVSDNRCCPPLLSTPTPDCGHAWQTYHSKDWYVDRCCLRCTRVFVSPVYIYIYHSILRRKRGSRNVTPSSMKLPSRYGMGNCLFLLERKRFGRFRFIRREDGRSKRGELDKESSGGKLVHNLATIPLMARLADKRANYPKKWVWWGVEHFVHYRGYALFPPVGKICVNSSSRFVNSKLRNLSLSSNCENRGISKIVL